jgi:hypothetical protein
MDKILIKSNFGVNKNLFTLNFFLQHYIFKKINLTTFLLSVDLFSRNG